MAALPFLILALLPFMSLAQTHEVGGGCNTLQLHTPDADVEYRPGVDANGWEVTSPDLHPPAIDPKQFDAVRLNLNLPAGQFTDNPVVDQQFPFAELNIGEVQVNRTGPSYFNGKPFGNTEVIPDPDCE